MQVLYLGRAPRTKETLPDFLKWRRVTRHSLVFRGLTGSQQTPGNGASHCTCLNVIVCHACALRWGVTHVGNYLYWALLILSRDHHFRYRERSGRRHSLEAV